MKDRKDGVASKTFELAGFLAIPEEANPTERPAPDLMAAVKRDLEPGFLEMGVRCGGLHVVSTLISLSVCPQFGVGPWGGGHGLMGYFMSLGDIGCAIACGSFYMGMTALLGRAVFNPDQRRALRAQGWLQFSWLVAASWGLFMLGGQAGAVSLGYGASWAAAAFMTGYLISRFQPTKSLARTVQ